jgi:pimeloyl-ACP methyl ester carboxylesterase
MTEASALARFRFSPPQPCENLYIVDWIARHSLRRARDPETGAEGFTWKFDPYLWSRLQRRDGLADLKAAKTRVAMVWGATSPLFPPETVAFCRETAPAGSIFAEIPEAAHHVMADQPLALVATTQAILSAWNG